MESLKSEINDHRSKTSKNEIRLFDEALREQMEENKRLKTVLTDKS